MVLKRYIVFVGINYEEHGGIDDMYESFDDLGVAKNECLRWLKQSPDTHWAHIFDCDERTKIEVEL